MPSSPPNGQRECGCPPLAKACKHFGDDTVWLITDPSYHAAHPQETPLHGVVGPCIIDLGQPGYCGCGALRGRKPDFYSGHLPAAEAEFRRREAAMLGREES